MKRDWVHISAGCLPLMTFGVFVAPTVCWHALTEQLAESLLHCDVKGSGKRGVANMISALVDASVWLGRMCVTVGGCGGK